MTVCVPGVMVMVRWQPRLDTVGLVGVFPGDGLDPPSSRGRGHGFAQRSLNA